MPNPKRRRCGSRQGKGRAHKKLHPTQLVACESCGAPKMRHRVCPSCGTYKGAEIKVIATQE